MPQGLYWGHRIQHEIPALWKLHAMHHGLETPTPMGTIFIDPIDATLQVRLTEPETLNRRP